MSAEQPLLPVGKDCDCGHPLVWRDGEQWCAVYGRHPARPQEVRFRNYSAPGARLVAELTAMRDPNPKQHRRRRARLALVEAR